MLALDHIVVAAIDAEESSAKYGNKFTIKAVKGGEHEDWGTYNYLSYFSNDSYIEWLGVTDEFRTKNAENPLIQHLVYVLDNKIPGPFQFALRTNEMDDYIYHFKEQNIPFKGPFTAQREKPDGTVLKWRMLFPEYNHEKELLPFLIEWENPKDAYPDTSLLNVQTITKINYSGIDRDKFAHIYQLKPRKLNKSLLSLQNCKINFNNNEKLHFDLV
ncbi:VOC family protein [Virgibacillus ndiopensis]|uniref:VOC family protein n=1 Tax=Virgibacillus ndiopensis TaxID=2004408 RepID=UPI000C077245|nr:VOC family protein [Virgibacillus ndiopensis]